MDAAMAKSDVDTVIKRLVDYRESVDDFHKIWFEDAMKLARSLNIQPEIPRRCTVQRHRSNTPADTPEVYYQRVVTIPMLGNYYM